MQSLIEVFLDTLSTDKAYVKLEGPQGGKKYEFPLLWRDVEDWKAIFWSLELYTKDSETWPDPHKHSKIVERAEKLSLFQNGKPVIQRFSLIGRTLYNTVFGNEEIRTVLAKNLVRKSKEAIPIIQLNFSDERTVLHAYPWELLHDKSNFLFISRRAYLVRSIGFFDQPIIPIELRKSITVLLIEARPEMPFEYEPLSSLDGPHLKKTASNHRDRFLVKDLSDFPQNTPTLRKLYKYFRKPRDGTSILHIDTHGDFGWRCQCGELNTHTGKVCQYCSATRFEEQESQGYLAFQDDKDRLAWISGDELGEELINKGVQIVVLSACKSALVSGPSAFNSVAGALIKWGIPAVVAMQFSIDEHAAQIFIEDFYDALLDGKPLTDAVAEARKGLRSISAKDAWYRPVLYLRTDKSNYRGMIFFTESSLMRRNFAEPSLEGGTMHAEAEFYIERMADKECKRLMHSARASTLFIQAPKQMGKSSLIIRMINLAKKSYQKETIFVNIGKLPKNYLADEEKFFREFCAMLGDKLELEVEVDKYWQSKRPNTTKCGLFLTRCVIPKINKPFILVIEEVEKIFKSNFCLDFFKMMCDWHKARPFDESLAKMTLILSSSIEPHLYTHYPYFSFSVANPILLEDFNIEEINELNRRYSSPLDSEQLHDLKSLINGHPYLTRLALYLLVTKKFDMRNLISKATEETGPFGAHLRTLFYMLSNPDEPKLMEALGEIHHHQTYEENETFFRLKGMGLIKKDGQRIVIRNNLYAQYFEKKFKW